ncbi:Rha family transcriptional regulator [Biomphalaria pfeifferi]|uniref:Rha family transcriptional regulator n=1 Tax=Biomphalaria pfeifferi TaxID=112525 RepID=A0AAD8ANP3_BIOPF|nr:Rha family transcriptional regulator [Biomphalaria pfeifferi]
MESIRTVLAVVSEEFSLSNFRPSTYQNSRNQTQPMYVLTRSGFAMIALGFTGEKAIKFREAYIRRFDEMEAQLHSKEIKKLELEYIKDRVLPFGEPVTRDYVSIGKAIFYIRMLGRLPELTNGKLKGMLVRGELEGFQNERGHWQIYEDQITKLLGGER